MASVNQNPVQGSRLYIDPNKEIDGWKYSDIISMCNEAIAVELFTIPLYITAAQSIKKNGTVTLDLPDNPNYQTTAKNTIMSVAVQEMFHLTLACNLANACGVMPVLTPPNYNAAPPGCLAPIKNLPLKGNLNTLIDTLLAIEKPDTNYKYDPDSGRPIIDDKGPVKPNESYGSIGDMYHALAYGINKWWKDIRAAAKKQKVDLDEYQKTTFSSKYTKVDTIKDISSAMNAIGAIVEQGEGNGVEGFMPKEYIPTSNTAQFHDEDEVSHYVRFQAIQKALKSKVITCYSATNTIQDAVKDQKQLTEAYSTLMHFLQETFNARGSSVSLRGMGDIGVIASNIWAKNVEPAWTFHADAYEHVGLVELHVCQGLNVCAGHGYKNSGSMPGDGDCATVSHACQFTNDCRSQGACGYPGKTSNKKRARNEWEPGANNCAALGGCQSPIAPVQYYPADKSNPHQKKHVWDVARALFEERMEKLGKLYAPAPKHPSARRVAQNAHATNPKPKPKKKAPKKK